MQILWICKMITTELQPRGHKEVSCEWFDSIFLEGYVILNLPLILRLIIADVTQSWPTHVC